MTDDLLRYFDLDEIVAIHVKSQSSRNYDSELEYVENGKAHICGHFNFHTTKNMKDWDEEYDHSRRKEIYVSFSAEIPIDLPFMMKGNWDTRDPEDMKPYIIYVIDEMEDDPEPSKIVKKKKTSKPAVKGTQRQTMKKTR